MCLYPKDKDKVVSGAILATGRWADCDGLTTVLRNTPSAAPQVHVEIGANIGSCILQVLLTTDATVFAFEPHPQNLFHLTSTLMSLVESLRERVYLFPIALGAQDGFSKMSINRVNKGNAQLHRSGAPVKNGQTKIPIERLDDVLYTNELNITLMKMDAQGYECFIMEGMPRTLSPTQNLVFEVEGDQVGRFKECSPASLVERPQVWI